MLPGVGMNIESEGDMRPRLYACSIRVVVRLSDCRESFALLTVLCWFREHVSQYYHYHWKRALVE
jgi:hypothetical protein